MKICNWVMAISMLVVSSAHAAPITMLLVDDPNVTAGEQFRVEVRLDNDLLSEELLSFGFDLQSVDPLLNYAGYSLGPGFSDASFGSNNIAGIAFPGISNADILLATLMFDALDVGMAQLSIEGLFDAAFSGLFYEFSGVDIAAQVSVSIAARASNVPEPPALFVFVMFAAVLLCCRKSTAGRAPAALSA